MRTHNSSFVFSWFGSALVAIAIVLLAAISTAKARDYTNRLDSSSIPDNIVNGLFTPTQSQRFFQEGRKDFEREVEFFNHPERYSREDILQFDAELIEQIDPLQPSSNFDADSSQYELHQDIIYN